MHTQIDIRQISITFGKGVTGQLWLDNINKQKFIARM